MTPRLIVHRFVDHGVESEALSTYGRVSPAPPSTPDQTPSRR